MVVSIKDIEAEMDEIRMLMKIWSNFYKILTATFYDETVDIEKLDPEFQQIKQIIAEHHSHFMKVIKKDFHIGQSILTTVKRTISLDGFHNLSPLEINKTLIEWHDANILLNETLGSLECDRDRILRGRKTVVPKDADRMTVQQFFQSQTFKNIVKLVVVLVVLFFIYLNWEAIHASSFYQNNCQSWLDPLLSKVGIPIPKPPAGQ